MYYSILLVALIWVVVTFTYHSLLHLKTQNQFGCSLNHVVSDTIGVKTSH